MIVVTDKAGRLKRIVFATCLQVALYCFYLGNANAQTGPAMPQVLSEQRVTPFMFKGAHHCFRYCSGRKVRFGEEHMAVRYNFVDFLSTSDWGQSAFEIGRAHVCTPVTNAQLVCLLLLAKKKQVKINQNHSTK